MLRRATLVLATLAIPLLTATASGPSGSQSRAARPYLPGYRVFWTHHHGWHRVDYRVDAWINIPATDQNTANLVAKHYRSHGWTTQTVQPTKGLFVVKAKMHRWQLATYTAHLRTAEAVAGLIRSQGYQAHVVY
jgi:hypothetical protein